MTRWMLPLLLVLAVLVYAGGLDGPFLFDDHIHISQNRWVHIESLEWEQLTQAWHSSFSAFPTNRPLAQLSFGLNHVAAGLSPWAYKATNLALHLLTGLAVFLFARLAYRALAGDDEDRKLERRFALILAAFWLLTPIQVSTVLYTVQRMAQISTLAMLLAVSSYIWGRLQLARGRVGIPWMIASAPIALIGFLGKENTVIVPLLLLVVELTLLQRLGYTNQANKVRLCWLGLIALPLLGAIVYLLTHPEYIDYTHRPFTLEQRLLSEPRILLQYLRMLLVPDLSLFGLYHDDVRLSQGVMDPPSTLLALVFWLVALSGALLLRRRAPAFAFAVLFFLASHVLESTVLPLEPMFEHRNYLAIVGPLFLAAWLISQTAHRHGVDRAATILVVLLIASHGFATWNRVDNWKDYESFVLSSAESHPESPRTNFMAGQLLIAMIANTEGDTRELERIGRNFLEAGLKTDPGCINCMFGLLILDLHLDRPPPDALVERLRNALASPHVGATKVSISQFSFLVKWHRSDSFKMHPEQIQTLFETALDNPDWRGTGRAGIAAAYGDYQEYVRRDDAKALKYADMAIAAWPTQWTFYMQKIRLLRKLERFDAIPGVLAQAHAVAKHASQFDKLGEIAHEIAVQLSGPDETH